MKKIVSVIIFALSASAFAVADDLKTQTTDYPAVANSIDETIRTFHYNPAELATTPYLEVVTAVATLASTVQSDEAFLEGFRKIWKTGPFSHVELNKATQSADELAAYLDTWRIGGGAVILSWEGDVAILTVNTMMGLDTIEEIDTAYAMIVEKGAKSLIIDLRENRGGAFAIRPLVGHLTDRKFVAGGFVSQPWNANNHRAPTLYDMKKVEPWEGWSIRAFWADVQAQALTVIQFSPIEPIFRGPVYVLTSERTASAAELATDAMKLSDRATIIGEKTAGEMLSQKIYDIEGGLHLSLPVADYYSVKNGRIEGVGVEPDITVVASEALNVALRQ